MLKAEVAQEQLKQYQIENWKELFEQRIQSLPEPLRVISDHLFVAIWQSRDPLVYDYTNDDIFEDFEDPTDEESDIEDFSDEMDADEPEEETASEQKRVARQEAHRQALVQLALLSPKDRLKLFAVWFPGLEHHVARAWKLWDRLPYQIGWARKSFRSLSAINEPTSARYTWIVQLLYIVGPYLGQKLPFFATWAAYVTYNADPLGILLAVAIESAGKPDKWNEADDLPPLSAADITEGEEIYETLLACGRSEHPIGAFGRHVCRSLFIADRPDGWEFMEKMLLAAQRQEGLRQVILETIDETHPDAFVRMLHLILDHDLIRFSSVVRAINVWLGYDFEAMTPKVIRTTIEQALGFLEDDGLRQEAVARGNGNSVFQALWAEAIRNADAAIQTVVDSNLLQDPDIPRRFAAIHFLMELKHPVALPILLPLIDDESLVCAVCAYQAFQSVNMSQFPDLFDRIERLMRRLLPQYKEGMTLPSPLWTWQTFDVEIESMAQTLLRSLDTRSPLMLTPYLKHLGYLKEHFIYKLARWPEDRAQVRALMFEFIQEKDSSIFNRALKALESMSITAEEALQVEALLKRTGAEIRRGTVALLATQNDEAAFATAQRLLSAGNTAQRSGGLEVLEALLLAGRCVPQCREAAHTFRNSTHKKSEADQRILQALLDEERVEAKLENGLGLFDPEQITRSTPPRKRIDTFVTPAAIACIRSLDALIVQHGETELQVPNYMGEIQEVLLGNLTWFPQPPVANALHTVSEYQQAREKRLDRDAEGRPVPPMNAVWEEWYANRSADMCDADGLELLRASAALGITSHGFYRWDGIRGKHPWIGEIFQTLYGEARNLKLKHREIVQTLLSWLLMAHPPVNGVDLALDAIETTFAHIPLKPLIEMYREIEQKQAKARETDEYYYYWDPDRLEWQENTALMTWLYEARKLRSHVPEIWSQEHHIRLFHLLRWLDSPTVEKLPTSDQENSSFQTSGGEAVSAPSGGLLGKLMGGIKAVFVKEEGPKAEAVEPATIISDQDLALIPRLRPQFIETLLAYSPQLDGFDTENLKPEIFAKGSHASFDLPPATEADLLDHLIGPQVGNGYGQHASSLHGLSSRVLPGWVDQFPFLRPLIDRVRARVLEVEFARTARPTAATKVAGWLRYSGGLSVLVKALALLGKETLSRNVSGDGRVATFSHIIRTTYPDREETFANFAVQMREAGIGEVRLIELAMFAPQWARFVEAATGWPELTEAVWWFHAHTKDNQWSVPEELKTEWASEAAQRTPLDSNSLLEGGVDVAWFHRVYGALGAQRWKTLNEVAKFASTAGGHKRAQLYADAMLGRADQSVLLTRIAEKRNIDSLRALGLLPLPSGAEEREVETLQRYKVIQEFVRTCKQFGPQRQASETRAATLSLENLARTAGYPDPGRLEWAMEAAAVADLAEGPVSVTVAETTFTLFINALGQPGFTITKNGKLLKAVPVAAKKDPAVVELQQRKKEIERQASRMRLSLEQSMCRGDRFAASELPALLAHPVLAPMLRSVLFLIENHTENLTENIESGIIESGIIESGIIESGIKIGFSLDGPNMQMGYPLPFGRSLQSATGEEIPLQPNMGLRIAHPIDLLNSGIWEEWQRDCFLHERVQPFKQIFRELYVLTENESDQKHISHRYDGHQLNPRQALAILGKRGWVSSYEAGPRRTFHEVGLNACLSFFEGYTTPAEVEGLTINGIYFTKRGDWEPIPLTQVPPRIFSEAMRDIDLAVSVAHQGGVDPEATASTIEMRAALLKESLRLLKIENVRIQSKHVLIDGQVGKYSIHLGSAVVHMVLGGALCIVPVHSQHRGRIFLPFADDDPKTAELISKVILLAKDAEIKDPIILEQILR